MCPACLCSVEHNPPFQPSRGVRVEKEGYVLTRHTISDLQDLSDALFDVFHASSVILLFVLYFSFHVLGCADPMVTAQPLEKMFPHPSTLSSSPLNNFYTIYPRTLNGLLYLDEDL